MVKDLALILAVILFFGLRIGYVKACAKLEEDSHG